MIRALPVLALVLASLVACHDGSSSSDPGSTAGASGAAGQGNLAGSGGSSCAGVDTQTDPLHCGTCGHSCLGGVCAAGVCQPVSLVDHENKPSAVQLDGERVVWLTDAVRAWTPSAGVSTLWSPPSKPVALAVGKLRMMVALLDGSVWRLGPGGEEPTKVTDTHSSITAIRAVGDGFYWSDFGENKLVKVDATGAFSEVSQAGCYPVNFVVRDGHAYVSSGACRGILDVSLEAPADTPARVVFQDLSGDQQPRFVALDGGDVVWTDDGQAPGLRATSLADGTTRTLLAFGPNPVFAGGGFIQAVSLAVTGGDLFYTTTNEAGSENGAAYRFTPGDAAPTPLSSPDTSLRSVDADATRVAWTTFGSFDNGQVYLVAR